VSGAKNLLNTFLVLAINLLKLTGYLMHQQVQHSKFVHSAHRPYLDVL
jgi:hypothetical protein